MKYKLETIPVIDAIKEDTECPLCYLYHKADAHYVKFYTGSSVMNPETRVMVNKTGFCSKHSGELYGAAEMHGVGLMMHTHLGEFLEENTKIIDSLISNGEKDLKGKQIASYKKKTNEFISRVNNHAKGCLICERIESTMKRYFFTIIYNWIKDPEFRDLLKGSRGFCNNHFPQLITMMEEEGGANYFAPFVHDILTIQKSSYQRLEEEIHWFTQMFKAENSGKSWGTSKDSPYRTLQKIVGNEDFYKKNN